MNKIFMNLKIPNLMLFLSWFLIFFKLSNNYCSLLLWWEASSWCVLKAVNISHSFSTFVRCRAAGVFPTGVFSSFFTADGRVRWSGSVALAAEAGGRRAWAAETPQEVRPARAPHWPIHSQPKTLLKMSHYKINLMEMKEGKRGCFFIRVRKGFFI